ncbi:hypothetical protein BN1007_10144 [Klebsiella variicola]|nr:hypothetical protein BN1007_10144 [Klebsiella variicola]
MSLLALRLAGLQFCAVRSPGKAPAATQGSLLALRLAGLLFAPSVARVRRQPPPGDPCLRYA